MTTATGLMLPIYSAKFVFIFFLVIFIGTDIIVRIIIYNVVIITTVYATTTAYFFQLSSHTARLRFHYVRSQRRTRDTYDFYHYYYHYYYYYTLGTVRLGGGIRR